MKQRPILFSAAMVRALLAGTKTQTRRTVKFTAGGHIKEACGHRRWHPEDPNAIAACPYGAPGDRLWVKETWFTDAHWHGVKPTKLPQPGPDKPGAAIYYAATHSFCPDGFLRPCLFMRQWMSRLTLEITAVRVERLQDISPEDAIAEGVTLREIPTGVVCDSNGAEEMMQEHPVDAYASLWESINGPDSWAANPWVWVVEFRRVEGGAL